MRQVLQPTETDSDIFSFRSSKGEIAFSGTQWRPALEPATSTAGWYMGVTYAPSSPTALK